MVDECRYNVRGTCDCERCHSYLNVCLINSPMCSHFMSKSDGEEYKTRATEAIQEFLTDITDEMNRRLNECSAKENEMSKCIYNFKGRCENPECNYFHGACNCHSTYECGCYKDSNLRRACIYDIHGVCSNEDDNSFKHKCIGDFCIHHIDKETAQKALNDILGSNVEHPNHYCQGGIECIEAIKASMDPSGFQDYCKGNVLKYIWRYRNKNGLEDLRKAKVYLDWLIESVEKASTCTVKGDESSG